MSRPRTPKSVAEVTGASVLHPGRHAGRFEPKVPKLGGPPKSLTDGEVGAWEKFRDEMPWLGKSDRVLVAIASKLCDRLMTDPEMGVNALAQLRMCLSSMGGTPADRSKVGASDEPEDDPAHKFFN